jgi:hypothetical protein
MEKAIADSPDMSYPYATLRLGIAVTRASLAFWSELADSELASTELASTELASTELAGAEAVAE